MRCEWDASLVSESSRVAKIARRVVLMFELYKQNIDPNDEAFLNFVSNHIEKKEVNVETISYYDLYVQVRSAIREYLRTEKE